MRKAPTPLPISRKTYPGWLAEHPVILLAAGDTTRDPDYPGDSFPHRVRSAVRYLCRFAFSRDAHILLAAEPTIVPIVLGEASRFARRGAPVTICHDQDQRFDPDLLDFANWARGRLLSGDLGSELPQWLAGCPSLKAAIFVGGGGDLLAQRQALEQRSPDLPLYPLGSTGGAAAEVLEQTKEVGVPGRGQGRNSPLFDILAGEVSYPIVLQYVFDDLGDRI